MSISGYGFAAGIAADTFAAAAAAEAAWPAAVVAGEASGAGEPTRASVSCRSASWASFQSLWCWRCQRYFLGVGAARFVQTQAAALQAVQWP